jgi:hypothetical protein
MLMSFSRWRLSHAPHPLQLSVHIGSEAGFFCIIAA